MASCHQIVLQIEHIINPIQDWWISIFFITCWTTYFSYRYLIVISTIAVCLVKSVEVGCDLTAMVTCSKLLVF